MSDDRCSARDRIAIIGCGKAKIWKTSPGAGGTAARTAYCGALFRATACYVETRYAQWYIISAKYGLLAPTDLILDYDSVLRAPSSDFIGLLRRQFATLSNRPLDVYAGGTYIRAIRDATNAEVTDKLRGMTLFERMRWLRNRTSGST